MGSVSVSSCVCICCMFVSCVHPVAVLNDAFCMTYRLVMLVEDARGDHMEEAYFFWICRGLCACTEMLWMCVLYVSFGSKVPEHLGALLWVVHCCVFLGPDCSYILQGMA